jgi:hypothetical protein
MRTPSELISYYTQILPNKFGAYAQLTPLEFYSKPEVRDKK